MQINFDIVLRTLDDEPIKVGDRCGTCGHVEEPKDLTLEHASITSLFNIGQDVKAGGKLERYILAQRIKQHPVVELSAEDITFLRKAIGDTYGPLVYGRVTEILDPGEVKKLSGAVEEPKAVEE